MKQLIITLTSLTLIAILTTLGLWLAGQPVAAAVIGAFSFFACLALLVAATAVVVSWWSATLMQRGATLSLRSQESDDRRDVAQIRAIGALATTLLRQARPEQPALPLISSPSQEWLPPLDEFGEKAGEQ